ncbi:hypothetical protein [Vulcanisaeta sp. JCM 14467]|uniref:hypothetical protein n=1 Tax=Vulcanisaeta sp. JCM 14467 TaxID=1295370 RepID=UPI0006CF72E0|nr:hypothetical protein [Vulcanisaeta sp. JCM 14467]
MGRQEYVREILNVYSDLLGMSKPINVATRLTIKYLGMDVEVPSNKEVFEVIKDDVIPDLRPAMAEILGIPISDVQKECERYKFIDSKACVAAYNAVKGDKEAEEYVKQKNNNWAQ